MLDKEYFKIALLALMPKWRRAVGLLGVVLILIGVAAVLRTIASTKNSHTSNSADLFSLFIGADLISLIGFNAGLFGFLLLIVWTKASIAAWAGRQILEEYEINSAADGDESRRSDHRRDDFRDVDAASRDVNDKNLLLLNRQNVVDAAITMSGVRGPLDAEWYTYDSDEVHGPVSGHVLKKMIADGTLPKSLLVSSSHGSSWIEAGDDPILRRLFFGTHAREKSKVDGRLKSRNIYAMAVVLLIAICGTGMWFYSTLLSQSPSSQTASAVGVVPNVLPVAVPDTAKRQVSMPQAGPQIQVSPPVSKSSFQMAPAGQQIDPSNVSKSPSDNSATWGAMFKSQVEKCWKKPYGGSETKMTEAEFNIRLKADGSLESTPVAVNSTTSPYVKAYQESAMRAVVDCQPYRLPGEHYNEWRYFTSVFTERRQ
jgi:UPF0716 family protein affecting phage T7 exclusion